MPDWALSARIRMALVGATSMSGSFAYGTGGVSATPFLVARTGTRYATLAQAVAGAVSSDTIKVASGTYVIPSGASSSTPGFLYLEFGVELDTLTIEWETPGVMPIIDMSAWAYNVANTGGRAIGIHAGRLSRNLTVRGLHLIGSQHDPSGSGSNASYGIYSSQGYEYGVAPTNPPSVVTVDRCKVQSWGDGLKATDGNSEITFTALSSVIEDCTANDKTHGAYISAINTFTVRGCVFRNTGSNTVAQPNRGHLLKSRARTTIVEGSLFDPVGGCACSLEFPNGGAVVVRGNIILHYGATTYANDNPPLKYGAEQQQTEFNVTLTGAISAGNTVTGATSGATGTVIATYSGGTRIVYAKTSGGTYFQVGEAVLVGGSSQGTITSLGGSIDGLPTDSRIHSLVIAQNTIRKLQTNWNGATPGNSIAAMWVYAMTTADGTPIPQATTEAAATWRNNIIAGDPCGAATLATWASNSAVAYATVSDLGVYSGAAIAGNPLVNDAAYAYAGEFTAALTRTDTFRGGRIAGQPTWRQGRTALRLFSVTPTATIASLNPALDAALNGNGAGNVPPWTGASYPHSTLLNGWSGGAYNRVTKTLKIRASGGHNGHQGNEGYDLVLNVAAPGWSRVCPPSGSIPRPATFNAGGFPVSGTTDEVCTDERPKAGHTYGVPVQIDDGRYFHMQGTAVDDEDLDNVWTQRPYRFAGSDWDLTGAPPATGYSQPSSSVYDPDLAAIWCIWGSRIYRYNPETLAVVSTTNTDGGPYYGVACYASGYVIGFHSGGGGNNNLELMVFATANPSTYRYHRNGTGGTLAIAGTVPPAVVNVSGSDKYYGACWDSNRSQLVLYAGGTRFFTCTPPASGSWVTGTWTWGEITVDSTDYAPGTDTGNGLYGRVFFDADYDVVGVQPSSVTAPLFFLPRS